MLGSNRGNPWQADEACVNGRRRRFPWTSLVVQGLGLPASTAGGMGWVPGQETKISPARQCGPGKNFP